MKHYKCKDCGTRYSSVGEEMPPPINWDDGHKCKLIQVEGSRI
jgi:hypothetical protein